MEVWFDSFSDSWIDSEGLTEGLSKVWVDGSQEGYYDGVLDSGINSEDLTDRLLEGWVESL